jgi:hypothetical protein
MWMRRSDEGIGEYLEREEAKRKSLLRPFLLALALSAGATILYALGYRGGWLRGGLVFVSSTGGLGARTLFVSAFFFAVALLNRRRRGASPYASGESLLCRECTQPFQANASGLCGCGGRLEPFAFFRWVGDEAQPCEA